MVRPRSSDGCGGGGDPPFGSGAHPGGAHRGGCRRRRISCADSLAEVRRLLTEVAAGCVLVDVSLPDAAGAEAVAVLSVAVPEAAIVVVSDGEGDDVLAALAEGADDYCCRSNRDAGAMRALLARVGGRQRGATRVRRRRDASRSVINSIEAAAVSLDGAGRIVAVNAAWLAAARGGGAIAERTGIGANYLTVCDRAVGGFYDGATEVAAGIRSVLNGDIGWFSMGYPCPANGWNGGSRSGSDRWANSAVARS